MIVCSVYKFGYWGGVIVMAFKALHEGFEKSSFKVKDAHENVLKKNKNSVN